MTMLHLDSAIKSPSPIRRLSFWQGYRQALCDARMSHITLPHEATKALETEKLLRAIGKAKAPTLAKLFSLSYPPQDNDLRRSSLALKLAAFSKRKT